MMEALAGFAGALAGVGVAQSLAGAVLVDRFGRRRRDPPAAHPPVTILKPLHGDEPLLFEALSSVCRQVGVQSQIVFGVQDPADPAIAVVRRLQQAFPGVDIELVVDPTLHGRNRKVGNLINMLSAARHDILVIADSDVHARPDYLESLLLALEQPGVGLVTTLYAGVPASPGWVARLGSAQITNGFLPGALLSRALGRSDCLGATMCLRRADLLRIGGLEALADHLADDNVLGRRIKQLGLGVALADTLVLTTVPETTLSALLRHELRWARTIRALEPAGFAASVLQYPLFWALLAVLLAGFAVWSLALLAIAWLLRAAAAGWVDRVLARLWRGDYKSIIAFSSSFGLLPLRDVLSVMVLLASYGGRQVDWRGFALHADSPARIHDSRTLHTGTTEDITPQ